jgi:hypothetical protein
MRRFASPLAFALAVLAGLATARTAHAEDARAEFQLAERGQPHVDMPFHLNLLVEGFDEQPPPEPPKLEIPNATVTFGGVEPQVSRGMQIVNGRRSEFTQVTWVIQWQVEAHKEGRLRIPAVTVSQGSKHATTQAAELPVETIPVSDSMKLSVTLPDRPIFVGESVPVTVTLVCRSEPQDLKWALPMAAMDAFTVSGPPVPPNTRQAFKIPAGGKEIVLPYQRDEIDQGGTRYARFVMTVLLAPRKIGKLDVPAASVVAALPIGRADFFGNFSSRLFRATDTPRTLEVKALPETDKPTNFAGAVGDQFSIDVQTSRSVVKLGEPVELAIRIKSNQRLDSLALGRLDGEGGLPKDKFVAPSEPATGELSDDGKTKTFKVTAQVIGAATEVPAIAFSYFDPTKTAYQTIHSEPIALSVAGGSVVRADDVVAAQPRPGAKQGSAAAANELATDGLRVDAELALSSPGQETDQPLGGALLWLLVGVLYAIPLGLYAARSWQLRTQGQRDEAAEVRAARKRIEELLDRSGSVAAREIAGPLAAAFRELARLLGVAAAADSGLLAKLETESFSQSAATAPLSTDLRSDAAGLLRRWTTEPRATRRPRIAPTAALALLAGLSLSSRAIAAPPSPAAGSTDVTALDDGRTAYKEAMQLLNNPTARKAAFARAETAFGEAVRALPDRPALLADWGNAALGAGDVATATLAYRRTLALDAGNPRARHNLAWLRSQRLEMYRPPGGTATDTLLFFHAWPRARKLIVGGVAFAIAILLLVPWAGRRHRGLSSLSLLPFAVWLAMLASLVLEDRHVDDAVAMEDVVLRAADSPGAPAALAQPLPRGVELTVLERRDAWTKVRIASGMAGWVPAGAVERVDR